MCKVYYNKSNREYECLECDEEFTEIEYMLEHLRKQYSEKFRRPDKLGVCDNNGHLWYCFSDHCETNWKDHRSFNSH